MRHAIAVRSIPLTQCYFMKEKYDQIKFGARWFRRVYFSYVEALFSVALSLLTGGLTLSNKNSMLIVSERELRITRSGW